MSEVKLNMKVETETKVFLSWITGGQDSRIVTSKQIKTLRPGVNEVMFDAKIDTKIYIYEE